MAQFAGIAGALVLAIVAVYAPVRDFEFINLDDTEYVVENPHVTSGVTPRSIIWAFTRSHSNNWHPLTWLSHMLDVEIFGLDAGGHHATSVLLHAVATILLFLVLRSMTGELGASAFVAMVFGLHPLRVESVAWVSERKDVLAACFWMLALGAYAGWVRSPTTLRYALLLVVYALGLSSKQMLVTLPVVLLLLDSWPLGRLRAGSVLLPLVREKMPLLAFAVLASLATLAAQGAAGAVVTLDALPLGVRVQNALVSMVAYLGMTLWPVDLALYYPLRPLAGSAVLGAAAVLGIVSLLVARAAERTPALAVGWCWYLVTLLPVIGLVQTGSQARADRFTYLPQVGLAIMLAWGARAVLGRFRYASRTLVVLSLVVGAACLALTARQVRWWRDGETVFRHTIAVTGDNSLAQNHLGEALARQGRLEEAHAHYTEAVRLNPANAAAQVNLGNTLLRAQRTAEAEARYREALRLRADLPEAHNGLGVLLAQSAEPDEALVHYRHALSARPYYPEARLNLANALRARGDFIEAAAEYRQVAEQRPDWPEVRYGLGVCLGSLGDVAGAEGEYRVALRLRPDFAEAYYGLSLVHVTRGAVADAIAALRQAVRLRPDWPVPAEALAYLLVTAQDPALRNTAEAITLAESARAAAGRDTAHLLETLALAYAAAGRLAEATATARAAIELARSEENPDLAAVLEGRLQSYERALGSAPTATR